MSGVAGVYFVKRTEPLLGSVAAVLSPITFRAIRGALRCIGNPAE
jgi:hypothetical protein